jgi:hypothetical protein
VARDRDIIIKSFSAGQTNTRAEKGFRMSKLLNVELDNFGDSISLINLVLYIQCAFQKLQLQYIHSLQFEPRRLVEKLMMAGKQ